MIFSRPPLVRGRKHPNTVDGHRPAGREGAAPRAPCTTTQFEHLQRSDNEAPEASTTGRVRLGRARTTHYRVHRNSHLLNNSSFLLGFRFGPHHENLSFGKVSILVQPKNSPFSDDFFGLQHKKSFFSKVDFPPSW